MAAQSHPIPVQALERQALRLTLLGNVLITLLGFGFALISRSEAVFLDSLFSGIHLVISLVTMQVSRLIQQPGNEDYPFGYAALEPMLNLGKGLVIAMAAIFALFSSIDSIRGGGRVVDADVALLYAAIAALGCGVLAVMQSRFARQSHSPILDVDAKNWWIDGLVSAAVAIAFGLILLLGRSPWANLVPYADPAIVILLVLIILPVPLQTIWQNWLQLAGRGPAPEKQLKLRSLVEAVLQTVPYAEYHLRPLNIGRLSYVQIYLRLTPEQAAQFNISQADGLRSQLYDQLQEHLPYVAMDLVVTCDRIWVKRAILPAAPTTATLPIQG
jgi:cation diffusion facilitator family transporter